VVEHKRQADQRVVRTRQKLVSALIELTLERGYETITIRDLVECAGIGYATFFRHYPDKDALLLDALQLFVGELTRLIQSQPASLDGAETGRLLFEFVEQQESLSRVFVLSHSNSALRDKLYAAGMQSISAGVEPQPGSPVPPAVAAYHLVSATIALVQWWFENDKPHSAARMGAIYNQLVLQPTLLVAFTPRTPQK
jgi:AcrR family transcriptional regulator